MKLIDKINLPQFNLGSLIGGIRFQAANSMFYMSGFSLFFSTSAAFGQLQKWFPFLEYWMIIAVVLCCYFMLMASEHIFIYRAFVTYTTRQAFGKFNPTVDLLQKMDAKLDKALTEIDRLKGIIDEKTNNNAR